MRKDYQFEIQSCHAKLIEDVASRLEQKETLEQFIFLSVMLKVVAYISNILWRILQI